MDLLFLHYSRIKRIDLAIRNKPNPLSFILKDLPALVSLSLALDMHELTRRTPNLLNIPSLRHLSLRGVTPDWGTMPLSQLTSLLLSGISFSADAPFISPLEACTSLEALQISFQASNTFPSTAHHTLSFPRMQHMQLYGAPAHIAHFLAQVSLPRHARLSLEPTFHPRYGNGDVDTAPVLQAFLPKVTGHLPYLSEARHLMMWVDIFYGDNVYITMYADVERTAFWDLKPWRSCRSTGGQYPDYEVPFKPLPGGPMVPLFFFIKGAGRQWREDVTDHSLKRMLHDLMPELDRLFPSSLETLILRGTTSLVDTQTWAHTLAAFPNIKQLEIIGQECDIDGFAEALEPTSAGMPCARLRELALQYEPQKQDGSLTILQTLRAVLQKRAEVAGGSRLQALSLLMVPARPRGYGLLPRVWLAEESRAAFDETLGDLESMVVSFVFGQIASVPVKRKDEGGQGQERDLGEDDFLEDQWSSEDQDQWSPESEE
ncbi:hypothetical protein EVJ58_g5338 [Rhodofomes roseus]|uniref:Uncharacterized protein n=1 Tax=Rhodofomes roseus TaxID=34475 RepID=A0A4Y9YGT2_9APHY|nr:hypothetical protein EVJ58_g5338 [Rhodofomes roseus]